MTNVGTIAVAIASGIGGAAITSFFTLLAAKAQIRAAVVSANRMRWVHIVRNTVSELASITSWAAATGRQVTGHQRRRDLFLSAKLGLLLNPNEEPSQALLEKLGNFRIALSQWQPGAPMPDFAEVQSAAQTVLKAEWVRVKKGE